MILERVILENFRQHTRVDQTLGPGLIGIVGPNGSGKSSFVRAILRSLTGETDAAKNEDDIQDFKDSGNIQTYFSIDGQQGFIKRHLKTSTCQLKFGDVNCRSFSEVNAAVSRLVAVSNWKKVLQEMIFVEQGKLEGVLFQRPAERAKAFQLLCGTDKAEDICSFLATEIKQAVAEDREPMITALEAELKSQVEIPIADATKRLGDIPVIESAAEKGCRDIISAYEVQQRTVESMTRAQSMIDRIRAELDASTRNKGSLEASINALRAGISALAEDYSIAKKRSEEYVSLCMWADRRREALVIVERAVQIRQTPEPKTAIDVDKLKRDQLELDEGAAQLKLYRRVVENFFQNDGGSFRCPTCTQEVSIEFVEDQKKRSAELAPTLKVLFEDVERRKAIQKGELYSHATWKSNLMNARKQHTEANELLAKMPTIPAPSAQQNSDDKLIVKEYEQYERDLQVKQAELENIVAFIRTMQQQLISAQSVLNVGPSQNVVLKEEHDQAKLLLEENNKRIKETCELTGRIKTLNERKQVLLLQIEQHKTDMQRLRPMRAWKELLERSRLVLHRDQLPAMVARSFIKPLNERLNHYLSMFQMPFTATINPDQSIECLFTNGVVRSAERLSGGQKVAMGIAFRFAVYDRFAYNLGFLVLDEPTAYLDQQRRESMLELLMNIKGYSRASGLQVIVVTHDESLMGAFDKVIEFKEPIYNSKDTDVLPLAVRAASAPVEN